MNSSFATYEIGGVRNLSPTRWRICKGAFSFRRCNDAVMSRTPRLGIAALSPRLAAEIRSLKDMLKLDLLELVEYVQEGSIRDV